MNNYTPENPPKRGTALKIWCELSAIPGLEMLELHYNPNCWGNTPTDGWGTWACHIRIDDTYMEQWCGWDNGAYLMKSSLPFSVFYAKEICAGNTSKHSV